MNKSKITSIFAIIIIFLIIALSGCTGIGDSDFNIRVSGIAGRYIESRNPEEW